MPWMVRIGPLQRPPEVGLQTDIVIPHTFGPPSDEIFERRPLASRGLKPYSVFEVKSSPWIRSLVHMNSVHPRHDPDRFADERHFIFTFRDSTFECIARAFEVVWRVGSMKSAIGAMTKVLS